MGASAAPSCLLHKAAGKIRPPEAPLLRQICWAAGSKETGRGAEAGVWACLASLGSLAHTCFLLGTAREKGIGGKGGFLLAFFWVALLQISRAGLQHPLHHTRQLGTASSNHGQTLHTALFGETAPAPLQATGTVCSHIWGQAHPSVLLHTAGCWRLLPGGSQLPTSWCSGQGWWTLRTWPVLWPAQKRAGDKVWGFVTLSMSAE